MLKTHFPDFMDMTQLAEAVRALRLENNLTQAQLAEMLIESGYTDRLSTAAISSAENPNTGAGMNALRIAAIELLTGHKVSGPYWRLEEDQAA